MKIITSKILFGMQKFQQGLFLVLIWLSSPKDHSQIPRTLLCKVRTPGSMTATVKQIHGPGNFQALDVSLRAETEKVRRYQSYRSLYQLLKNPLVFSKFKRLPSFCSKRFQKTYRLHLESVVFHRSKHYFYLKPIYSFVQCYGFIYNRN